MMVNRKQVVMVNNLKQRRNECGLTQAEVASAANVTTVCYQLYEYDKRIPRADVAIKIAKSLGTTVEELFSDD